MSVSKSVESLREDLSAVKSDLVLLTSELATIAQAGTQDAKDRLFARISMLQSRALSLQEQIRQGVDHGVSYLDERVHAKPYHTSIAAGIVGGLLVWLVTRPRN